MKKIPEDNMKKIPNHGTEENDEVKRLDLDPVDDDYEEWVICEPVRKWTKNGIECVVERKKWYRKEKTTGSNDELMTDSYIAVIRGPDEIADISAERINEVLDVDNPNGVVKRGTGIGFDTIHSELVEGDEVSEEDIVAQTDWIVEQLTMLM